MSGSSVGRERILNEAYLLFIRDGFAEVSMQQIADSVGITKATMYHHFRGKDDLYAAVCRRELERMRVGVAELVAAGGPIRDLLERVARFFLLTGGDADFVRLFSDFRRHLSEERRRELLRDGRPPNEMLRPIFEQAIRCGELRPMDPDLAVELFLGVVIGQIKFATDREDPHPPDPDRAGLVVDALLDGIGVPAAVAVR